MRKGLFGPLAGLGAALIVGALAIGVAVAQAPAGWQGVHGAVLARAAATLGVSEARLTDALAQAHDQALDDAVRAGQLSQAQADWMKQRHRWMMRNGGGPGMMGG